MDKHTNVFNSYSGGGSHSPERLEILEDNVTRALIVVLRQLQKDRPTAFREALRQLTNIDVESDVCFDLQSFSDAHELSVLQRSSVKRVLLITRDGGRPDWSNNQFKGFLEWIDQNKLDEQALASLKSQLKQSISNGKNFVFKSVGRNYEFGTDESQSLWELLVPEARPDAWIYEPGRRRDRMLLAIESKVGSNRVSREQIYRHVTSKRGLAVKAPGREFLEQNVLSVSWSQVGETLLAVPLDRNSVASFLIDEFFKYLKLSGEIMSFEQLNRSYDGELARQQFSLVLQRLDERLKNSEIPLYRLQRPKVGLWDKYGLKGEKDKPKVNPDFAVSISPRGFVCGLNFNYGSNKKGSNKILRSELFDSVLSSLQQENPEILSRYWFGIARNRIVDHINGQQHGEAYRSLEFWANLQEKNWQGAQGRKNLCEVAERLLSCGGKEVYLEMRINWVDEEKVKKSISGERRSPLRQANFALFKDPDRLIEATVAFADKTRPLIVLGHEG